MRATYQKHVLQFKSPGGTSRGVMDIRETWFLLLKEGSRYGVGECGFLRGLSMDDPNLYESRLQWVCDSIALGAEVLYEALTDFPSIQFGVETAFRSFFAENTFELFPSEFTLGIKGIPINGLVWMGDEAFMKQQISEKISEGFKCIKMKIGAIAFETEVKLLKSIRKEFAPRDIELRVDANGAFTPSEAKEKLHILSELNIHSIEQPIKQGQWQEMARLCENSPLPVALDEELIGVVDPAEKAALLKTIHPHYIILKPALIGGFRGSDEWITLAEWEDVGWWVTSALESNVGLNAISQYTFTKRSKLPQGLGTGSLYKNNIGSPLTVKQGTLKYKPGSSWETSILNF